MKLISQKASFFRILSKIEAFYFPELIVDNLAVNNSISLGSGTITQYLLEAVKNKIVFDAGRGWYSSLKKPFILDSKPVKKINTLIQKGFPLLDFTTWSTEQLNPYAQHLMNRFITFVYLDPDLIKPVSYYLNDKGYSAYPDPGKDIINDMFQIADKTVILRKAISKQPAGKNHAAPVEKILVDLVREVRKVPFMEQAEAQKICNNATGAGRVNMAELLGYAKRRKVDFSWLATIS